MFTTTTNTERDTRAHLLCLIKLVDGVIVNFDDFASYETKDSNFEIARGSDEQFPVGRKFQGIDSDF